MVVVLAPLAMGACTDMETSQTSGFAVGMSQLEAFDLACDKMTNGSLHLGPILYIDSVRRPVRRTESICQIRDEALRAGQWWVIQPGLRERFIVFDFEDHKVVRLRVMWRGWYP